MSSDLITKHRYLTLDSSLGLNVKALIGNPLNDTQRVFNSICEKGGGPKGGPARSKVLELLRDSGQSLNKGAFPETSAQFAALPDANPWYICFAIALSWGHLAKFDVSFTRSVVNVLTNWNATDLRAACSFHLERGPTPVEQSLIGAQMLFDRVTLPRTLPTTLEALGRAQERWLSPVLNKTSRPPYIGSWNATAMFMVALFAKEALAKTHVSAPPMLPPGGPIFQGLSLLHRAGIISKPPSGSELDDEAFEPGAIYENNALFAELCKQLPNWCLIDVHSGIYMLGTRHPAADKW